jgi:hypothetical protein
MIRSILSAVVLSLMVVSAAWAWPASPTTQLTPVASTDLIQIGYHGGGTRITTSTTTTSIITTNITVAAATTTATGIGAIGTVTVPMAGRLSAASPSVRSGTAHSRQA